MPAEQDSTINALPDEATNPSKDDLAVIYDANDTVTKKMKLATLFGKVQGYTKTVAPASLNVFADYYTDGVDDHVQINAALLDCFNAGGGTVLLKTGTYNCSANVLLRTNTHLKGEGWSTIIIPANNTWVDGDKRTNFKISDLRIDDTSKTVTGSPGEFQYCIRLLGCKRWRIDNCQIDAYAFGIFAITDASSGVLEKGWINECDIQSTRRNDTLGGGPLTDVSFAVRDVLITNCHVRKVVDPASVGGSYAAMNWTGVQGLVVANTRFEGVVGLGYERDPNERTIFANCNISYAFGSTNEKGMFFILDLQNTTDVSGKLIIANVTVDGCIFIKGLAAQKMVGVSIVGCQTFQSTARTNSGLVPGGIPSNGIMLENVDRSKVSSCYCDGGGVTAAGVECKNSNNNSIIDVTVYNHGTGLADTSGAGNNNWSLNTLLSVTTPMAIASTSVGIHNTGGNPMKRHVIGNVGATETIDRKNGDVQAMVMDSDCTFTFASAYVRGDKLTLVIAQDATGGRVATWPSNFKKAGGSLVLSTDPSAVDTITMEYDGTNWNETSRSMNLS